MDEDGWGADAPQVTRSQLEKVDSAYKPTKVNLADLTRQNEDASRSGPARNDTPSDVVRGGYQPIGKVDIAAIRKQAAESGSLKDERPAPVKGTYEPVGKVDIAAIRAKAQGPGASPAPVSPARTGGDDEAPKSLSERSSAFSQQPERLTTLPKPKVANKFGNTGFTGTKPPAPAYAPKPLAAAAPVGTASKTFADEGGKTPAQIWAEKKARERGLSGSGDLPPGPAAQPIASQQSGSGGWKSGYSGKSWATVQTTHTGASNLSAQRTGEVDRPQEEAPSSPAGGVGALRDRFKEAPPMGGGGSAPPPMDMSSKPNAGRGPPGLPSRPTEDDRPDEEHVAVPPPPAQPRSPTPPSPDVRPSSPIRIIQPVARNAELEPAEQRSPPPAMPTESIAAAASAAQDHLRDEPQDEDHDTARGAGIAAAEASFGAGAAQGSGESGGKRAVAQYDYEKAEDNEIELAEGELITNIDMVDEDWWMGQNSRGEAGLFPSNYVELIEDEEPAALAPAAPAAAPAPPAAPPATGGSKGPSATALYDYEAAEDNELSFPDGATINDVVCVYPFSARGCYVETTEADNHTGIPRRGLVVRRVWWQVGSLPCQLRAAGRVGFQKSYVIFGTRTKTGLLEVQDDSSVSGEYLKHSSTKRRETSLPCRINDALNCEHCITTSILIIRRTE